VKVLVHNGLISGCSQHLVPWASNILFTENKIFPYQECNISTLSFTWNHLTSTALYPHTHCVLAFYSLEVTFSLWLHWTYHIPISLGVLMLQTSHTSSALACPMKIWDPSQTISLLSFQSWLSEMYEMEVLQGQKSAFYAYSREERTGHPVPPRHFYSWAQTQPCWLSSCGWTSTIVPPFRKDIAGSHTMKLKASCCK